MGIQIMGKDTGFLLYQLCELGLLWKIALKRALHGLQLPILHKGCSYGFPQSPLTRKEYNKEGQQGAIPPTNFLISLLPSP